MKAIKIKNLQPVFVVLAFSVITYWLYKLVFNLFNYNQKEALFMHSLTFLFVLFASISCTIIVILQIVKIKNFDSVGYAFMALTSLKIGILLFWAQPILRNIAEIAKFEKINFFILFALFLAIETIVAAQILNNKQ